MTNAIAVTTKEIEVAGVKFNAYRLPNGEYRVSLSQFAKALGADVTQARRGLKGDTLERKALSGKGLKGDTETTLLTPEQMTTAVGYLAGNGNKQALAYLVATSNETLTRRLDAVFGVEKTNEDYEAQTRAFYRELARTGFTPKYTNWLKADQDNGTLKQRNYGVLVNQLKTAAQLPKVNIDEYETKEIEKWTEAIMVYNGHRNAGFTHKSALTLIAGQFSSAA